MLLLALTHDFASNDIDWQLFAKLVNNRIAVVKNTKDLEFVMNQELARFAKTSPAVQKDEIEMRSIFRVQNSTCIGFSMGNFFEAGQAFIARPNHGKYRLEMVDDVKKADRFMLQHAVMSSGRLVATGQEHSGSNYMSPAAASYQFENGRWKVAQFQSSKFEGGVGEFKYQNSRWESRGEGRTYPKHIDVPHSGAEVQMERTFSVQRGMLANSPQKYVPCVMKTMDDLIHAIDGKNWSRVTSLCVSPKVAKDLRAASAHSKKVRWQPISAFHEKSLCCQIPETDKAVTVERAGGGWKVTKLHKLVN